MTSVLSPAVSLETIADLLDHLGSIAPERVRLHPAPGTATEDDLLSAHDHQGRLCELVDGVLVEKAMGFRESLLAGALIEVIRGFVRQRNLGLVTAPDGMMRLAAGLVRIPDVAFIAWDRLPHRRVPTAPIPTLAPDLAVEVLSAGNTSREMARKCREYFAAGVRLVWLVDPETRTVAVYTTPEIPTILSEEDTLQGEAVLPGFTLSIKELFAELDQQSDDAPTMHP
jgi:Uma2 family endonuclease